MLVLLQYLEYLFRGAVQIGPNVISICCRYDVVKDLLEALIYWNNNAVKKNIIQYFWFLRKTLLYVMLLYVFYDDAPRPTT